jgi:hypothetical protein
MALEELLDKSRKTVVRFKIGDGKLVKANFSVAMTQQGQFISTEPTFMGGGPIAGSGLLNDDNATLVAYEGMDGLFWMDGTTIQTDPNEWGDFQGHPEDIKGFFRLGMI